MSQIQSPSKLLKILVVDDHEAVLGGTIDAINKQYPEASVFQAKTAERAIEQVNNQSLDLAITDLSIPAKTVERNHFGLFL